MKLGLGIGVTYPRNNKPTLVQSAIDVIRRLNGTALFIPDDYGWQTGPERITTVNSGGGSLSGIDFVEDLTNTYHGASFVNSTTLKAQFKFRAKAGTKSWVWTRFEGYAGGNAWFNLSTGSVGTVESAVTASMTDVGDGYYECTLTNKNALPAGNCTLFAVTSNGSTATYTGTGSVAFQLASYSVKEITGAAVFVDSTGTTPVTAVGDLVGKLNSQTSSNHATRPTTASKPVVTRVPKRLGPNLVVNGTFDTDVSGWLATNGGAVSVSGGELVVTNAIAQSGRGYQMVPTEVGKPYLITSFARAGTASAIVGWGTLAGSSAGGSALTASAQTLQLAFVATNASTSITLQTNTATAGHTAIFDNIEVREVLEWTNALSFDGSNDFLQTGITTGNEGWVCAGVTPSSITSYRTIAHTGVLGSAKGIWLLSDLGRWVMTTFTNSAGHSTAYIDATTSPTVVSGGWNVSTVLLEVNGQSVSAARTGDCVGTTPLRIGITSADSFLLSGDMTAIVICPILPSAADRALIRKWIGSLQGQTL